MQALFERFDRFEQMLSLRLKKMDVDSGGGGGGGDGGGSLSAFMGGRSMGEDLKKVARSQAAHVALDLVSTYEVRAWAH